MYHLSNTFGVPTGCMHACMRRDNVLYLLDLVPVASYSNADTQKSQLRRQLKLSFYYNKNCLKIEVSLVSIDE